MVWYGMACVVLHGMVRYCMEWIGMEWHGIAPHGRCCRAWYGMEWNVMAWSDRGRRMHDAGDAPLHLLLRQNVHGDPFRFPSVFVKSVLLIHGCIFLH